MKISTNIIVAMAKNRVIGKNNDLPWHIPEELAYFKKTTKGSPVIMGRKNYESIGRLLPGRLNIIVTRQKDYKAQEKAIIVNSVEEAINLAKKHIQDSLPDASYINSTLIKNKDAKKIWVIGGSQIYKYALDNNLVDKIYLTEIQQDFDGNVLFPEYNKSSWKTESERREVSDSTGITYVLKVLRKKG